MTDQACPHLSLTSTQPTYLKTETAPGLVVLRVRIGWEDWLRVFAFRPQHLSSLTHKVITTYSRIAHLFTPTNLRIGSWESTLWKLDTNNFTPAGFTKLWAGCASAASMAGDDTNLYLGTRFNSLIESYNAVTKIPWPATVAPAPTACNPNNFSPPTAVTAQNGGFRQQILLPYPAANLLYVM